MNRQRITSLPLPQDVIKIVHCLACRNPKGLGIRDRDRCTFLNPEDRTDDDKDDSAYALSDHDISDNEYESDNNQINHDNLQLPPDQEMAQGPAGVTIKNYNVRVHQNENAGVHQNANTHLPQSGHNDPHNELTIKREHTIDVIGNDNEAKNEDGNVAKNEDEDEHEDLDEDENEQKDLE